MKYGPFVFLGLLFALALSWLGMIATPQLQFGSQQPASVPPVNVLYPTPEPGLAVLGREVYRANGCSYCHTQVVRQEGTRLDVVLTSPGTNEAAVVEALASLKKDLQPSESQKLLSSTPSTVITVTTRAAADDAQKALTDAGAEAGVKVVPLGPDIARGWGTRLTVGRDYVYQTPLMLGSTRLGPDLSNIGFRRPDEVRHMVHLYDPKLEVAGSTMPRYPFLFEKRRRGPQPSPDALPIPGDYDVIPTREARALAAYLVNLRVEMPLFEAPAPQLVSPPSGAGDTNQAPVTGTETNAPASGDASALPSADQTPPK